jgi:hypothetical protein
LRVGRRPRCSPKCASARTGSDASRKTRYASVALMSARQIIELLNLKPIWRPLRRDVPGRDGNWRAASSRSDAAARQVVSLPGRIVPTHRSRIGSLRCGSYRYLTSAISRPPAGMCSGSRHAGDSPSCRARERQSSEPIFWQAFPAQQPPSLVSADGATWRPRSEVRSARRRAKRRCRPVVARFAERTGRHNCLISIRRVPLRSISRIAK